MELFDHSWDYREKYEHGLECIQEILGGAGDLIRTSTLRKRLQPFFPELEENEEERIRKEFCKAIWTYIPNEKAHEYIAWLERQRESNTFKVPETSIEDAVEVTSRMKYINDDMKPIADFIVSYAHWDLHKDEWNQPTLTVPLFRVLDALIQRGKPYGCTKIEEHDEQPKKWILEYLYDGLRKSDEQFKSQFKAAIAWLEKQGDNKESNDEH